MQWAEHVTHWMRLRLILHSCYGLATLKNILVFSLGSLCTIAFYRWRDMMSDKRDPEHAPHKTVFRQLWVFAAIGIVLFGYIAVRTQVSAERADTALNWTRAQAAEAKSQAEHNKECFNHLADVMRERGKLSDKLQPEVQGQLDILAAWLMDIDQVPNAVLREKYSELLKAKKDEQNRLSDDRASNPVPDPSCPQ